MADTKAPLEQGKYITPRPEELAVKKRGPVGGFMFRSRKRAALVLSVCSLAALGLPGAAEATIVTPPETVSSRVDPRPPPPSVPPPVCDARDQIAPPLEWHYDRTVMTVHIPTGTTRKTHFFFVWYTPSEWGDIPNTSNCTITTHP